MVHKERISLLNREPARNRRYVLYWMQASQRAEANHALEYALGQANARRKPLVVFFGITSRFPEANLRHYVFMLEGLRETRSALRERGINLVVWVKSPELGAVELAQDSCVAVVDRGYLRLEKLWRKRAALKMDCPLIEVESNSVVPVAAASAKEEFSARTFRPKITSRLGKFLVPLVEGQVRQSSLHLRLDSLELDDLKKVLARLRVDRTVGPVDGFHGGPGEAKRRLLEFVGNRLDDYAEKRNDPTAAGTSGLSPYLHFGQISPISVALEAKRKKSAGLDAFLEEVIVRRELALNFVYYNTLYDAYEGLPAWCLRTLKSHRRDRRKPLYTLSELEKAETHDRYWNAAQMEMVISGKMHGYMRMYWGKKILEWSRSPEEAFKNALYLNNKYELDGRDPNGFAGVAWCFGKHDRPWFERPIFGQVRFMGAGGLERKFDADEYAQKIETLSRREGEAGGKTRSP